MNIDDAEHEMIRMRDTMSYPLRKRETVVDLLRAQLREEQRLHVVTLNERDELRAALVKIADIEMESESDPWSALESIGAIAHNAAIASVKEVES